MTDKILFLIERGNAHVVTYSFGREDAKRTAYNWLGGNSDHYTVTPLTEPNDRIHFDFTLYA